MKHITAIIVLFGLFSVQVSALTNQWEAAGYVTNGLAATLKFRRAAKEYTEALQYQGRHADVRRAYNEVRWARLGVTNQCAFIRNTMRPYFQNSYPTTGKAMKFRKRLVTQYRLLKSDGEEVVLPAVEGHVIQELVISTLEISDLGIAEWLEAHEYAEQRVSGLSLKPAPFSPLGYRWRALKARIDEFGKGWYSDPEIKAEWQAYWKALGGVYERRNR